MVDWALSLQAYTRRCDRASKACAEGEAVAQLCAGFLDNIQESRWTLPGGCNALRCTSYCCLCATPDRVARACRAAQYSERDNMTGVSTNIILGQLAPLGTGSFGLLLDDTRLADAIEVRAPSVRACGLT